MKASSVHLSPFATAAKCSDHSPELIDRRELTKTELFQQRPQDEQSSIDETFIPTVTELVHEERCHIEEHAPPVDHETKEQGELNIERAKGGAGNEPDETDHLHQRSEQFDSEEVRKGNETDRTKARIERKFAMPPQHINETALPPISLSFQRIKGRRCLCPCDWLWNEYDAARAVAFHPIAPEAHHEFHVLADALGFVSANAPQGVAPEESERSGNDEIASETIPSKTPKEKRPKVFNTLHPGKESSRRANRDNPSRVDVGAIRDSNCPS